MNNKITNNNKTMITNRLCINLICLFTQIMWFHIMGLTTPFQIRTNNYYASKDETFSLIR